jgi:hypothetical protein
MDAWRDQLNRPVVVGAVAFIAGLFIGLVVLGWGLWPVQWTDAGPDDLRAEFKEIYLRMAIDSYTVNQDAVQAQQRLQELGPEAPEILGRIETNPGQQNPGSIQAMRALAGGAPQPPAVEATPGATPAAGAPRRGTTTLILVMCAITFVLFAALVVAFLLRGRISAGRLIPARKEAAAPADFPDIPIDLSGEPPIAQFMTTYQLGNDLFDDSFSIDSQAGEFLGECGVGISDTIGVGEPKRVTAFEVWLFDKNDIQTVTQVLMSDHAFYDEATRQRLAAKGEPVLADAGKEMVLETATLRMIARVVDMSYGSGALPPDSFFERLTLELTVWPKG